MKELGKLDENLLWQSCFPHCWQRCAGRGLYELPEQAELLAQLKGGLRPLDAADALELRVEMACAALWPDVSALFVCALFPHVLACATDVLRAVDFGEHPANARQQQLIMELTAAVDEWERGLSLPEAERARLFSEPPAGLLFAAEPEPEPQP